MAIIDGGATGISLLISFLTKIPLYLLIITVNIPFIILGYKTMGKAFAIKTMVAISALALVLASVNFPNVTNDNLLVAIFGGFFLGAGIGHTVRGGAVIDGTEIIAIYLSRKLGTTIGDIIILINVLIFSAAAYYLSIEIASGYSKRCSGVFTRFSGCTRQRKTDCMRVTAVVGHKSQEPEEGTWVVVTGDESSLSLTANQQIFRRHLVNRLAHRSLTHIEARRQFAFAGY